MAQLQALVTCTVFHILAQTMTALEADFCCLFNYGSICISFGPFQTCYKTLKVETKIGQKMYSTSSCVFSRHVSVMKYTIIWSVNPYTNTKAYDTLEQNTQVFSIKNWFLSLQCSAALISNSITISKASFEALIVTNFSFDLSFPLSTNVRLHWSLYLIKLQILKTCLTTNPNDALECKTISMS